MARLLEMTSTSSIRDWMERTVTQQTPRKRGSLLMGRLSHLHGQLQQRTRRSDVLSACESRHYNSAPGLAARDSSQRRQETVR